MNYATGVSTEKQSVMTENKLTYITSFEDKHSIQAYLAVNSSTSQSNGQTIESYGHPGSNLSSPTSEAYMRNFENHFDKDRSISALARAHYVYLGRYIVDVNMRMDGSTKFGPNNRYGFFPGISAKWIISDEMFMSSFSEWLTLFAIRPSWEFPVINPEPIIFIIVDILLIMLATWKCQELIPIQLKFLICAGKK